MTAEVEGFAIQFKVSAPNDALQAAAQPAAVIRAVGQATGPPGGNGILVTLHGDGGQSFFDFPNQRVQNDLMGVVLLAPNDKMFWGGGAGNRRTDGELHSKLVDELIRKVLPQVIKMDPTKVFFMGISGGSLLLSGFFMPLFAATYNTGVIFGCGALPPQIDTSPDFGKTIGTMRMHFQATTGELTSLQVPIAAAIVNYARAGRQAGVPDNVIGNKLTADTTPRGGHCAFDGKGFVSGVQLLSDDYANIILGKGDAKGIGNVATSVLANTQTFASGQPLAKVAQRGGSQS